MSPDPYRYMPGGKPAWPSIQPKTQEDMAYRLCIRCGTEKTLVKFAGGCKTCNLCYDRAAKAKRKVDLQPKRLFPVGGEHRGGAYSKA